MIDAIDANCIMTTWIAVALVNINLTIWTRRSGRTSAAVAADLVLAVAAVLTRVRFAFINLGLTAMASVAWTALARKRVVAIDADATIAW